MQVPGTNSQVSESILDLPSTEDGTGGGSYRKSANLHPRNTFFNSNARNLDDENDDTEVDTVVVDNVLMHSGQPGSVTHSEHNTSPEGGGGLSAKDSESNVHGATKSEEANESIWEQWWILTMIRWRAIPAVRSFFSLVSPSHFEI